MIVRIIGEGQFQLDDALIYDLNELDGQLQEQLDASDEARFSDLLHRMAGLVRERGTPVPDEELVRSNAILPPEDATLDEVRALLGAEGLIPG
jgi:hypothetical protein